MSSRAEPETNLAIGAEARELLARLAAKSGCTPSAVLDSAIREKAQREQVMLPVAEGSGAEAESAASSPLNGAPPIDLRPLAARAAGGDSRAEQEMQRIIKDL